jgi:hypothetical protein
VDARPLANGGERREVGIGGLAESDAHLGWGAEGVVDGAVVDDRQQGLAAVLLQGLGEEQPQGDGVDPGRAVGAHGVGGLDPQPSGVQVVAGQEASGVEGDAGGQAGDE